MSTIQRRSAQWNQPRWLVVSSILFVAMCCGNVAGKTARMPIMATVQDSVADSLSIANIRAKASQDLKRMKAAYRDAPNLSLEIDQMVFAEYSATQAIQTNRSRFIRRDRKLYNDAFGTIIIIVDSTVIQIDSEDRLMLISRAPAEQLGEFYPQDIDSTLEFCDSIAYQELPGHAAVYHFYFDDSSEYRRMDVQYNRLDYLVQKTTFLLTNQTLDPEGGKLTNPRVEIVYRNLDDSKIHADLFREGRYFQRVGRKLICSANYPTFTLSDMRVGIKP
jgi:hypothetical protein